MNKNMYKKRNYLWRLFTFSGYISSGSFWSEVMTRLIGFFCAVIIMCIILSVTVPGETEDITRLCECMVPVLGLVWAIPLVALTRRRLRDAGYSAKSYLWLLLPIIGWIVFIVRLCGKSVKRDPFAMWFD